MLHGSNANLFNKNDLFNNFKTDIAAFCAGMDYDFLLSDAEVEVLLWNVGSHYQSPEAGKNTDTSFSHLPFEVKRSLARAYSFELILRGDVFAYRAFVAGQTEDVKLSYNDFRTLVIEAGKLEPDVQAVIRATCFLVGSGELRKRCHEKLSDAAKTALAGLRLPTTISSDSEEFISQFAVLVNSHPELTPITHTFTPRQNALLIKAFWPGLHMRWLYSSEGANNMTATLSRGIIEKTFNQDTDLSVWAWRWRMNVAGFQGGPAASFLDAASNKLIQQMLNELHALFADPSRAYLANYLSALCTQANLDTSRLTNREISLAGHLLSYFAYYHRVDIFQALHTEALQLGLQAFKANFPDLALAEAYEQACLNPDAITPTYLPGLMDTAFCLVKCHLDAVSRDVTAQDAPLLPASIDKQTLAVLFTQHQDNIPEAISMAVQFICQVSAAVYSGALRHRVSCQELAKTENLKPILEAWIKDPHTVSFSLVEGREGLVSSFAAHNVVSKRAPSMV